MSGVVDAMFVLANRESQLRSVLISDSEQVVYTDLLLKMVGMHISEMLPSKGWRQSCALLTDLVSNSHIGLVEI